MAIFNRQPLTPIPFKGGLYIAVYFSHSGYADMEGLWYGLLKLS